MRMFTGIISELGTIEMIDAHGENRVFTIRAPATARGVKIGDSVAVNGACHTVIRKNAQNFTTESMPETLARTNLGLLKIGSCVNLERPVIVNGRLDGHIVTGHVDVVVRLAKIERSNKGVRFTFAALKQWLRFVVEKGSVTLDGVSLTVAAASSKTLTVALIPHTLSVTTFGHYKVGDWVNLETDILAKHVAKLVRRA